MIRPGSFVPQHIRDNKESHMTTADVDLFEMADAPVAGCNGDVLELDVHVVFGCCREAHTLDLIHS